MGIKARFTKRDIEKMIQARLQIIDTVIVNRFILVGEKFVKNARENGSYRDQTGNLRSSIGYVVMKNGVVIRENFKESANGTTKAEGKRRAVSFIETLKAQFGQGYCLIVVAGMKYAAAVESKGKDVLTGSSLTAETDLQKAMSEIKRKINKR